MLHRIAGCLLVGAVCGQASAGRRYVVTDLLLVFGKEVRPAAINNRGDVVANSWDYETQAFAWIEGQVYELSPLGDDTRVYAWDINDAGIVVGESRFASESHGFVWEKGNVTSLGGLTSVARAVNERGDLVGGYREDYDEVFHAVLWREGKRYALPGDVAFSINDHGTVAMKRGAETVMLWADGRVEELGEEFGAWRMGQGGEVVGAHVQDFGSGRFRLTAFLWQAGTVRFLEMLPWGVESSAKAVNRSGEIVGWMDDCSWPAGVLWDGGEPIVLEEQVAEEGWSVRWAEDINDCGEIVGYGYFRGIPVVRGVLLTPDVLRDFRRLTDCLAGPAKGLGWCCHVADEDRDGDVDLEDFGAVQRRGR